MTLIELPRRRDAPRTFVEPPSDIERRVSRALTALGALDLDLPGLPELGAALIAIADELAADADFEPEDDADAEEEGLPLFAFAARGGR